MYIYNFLKALIVTEIREGVGNRILSPTIFIIYIDTPTIQFINVEWDDYTRPHYTMLYINIVR